MYVLSFKEEIKNQSIKLLCEALANSLLAVKFFAGTLPLVAKSVEVVNHFAANIFFAATLQ